MTEKDYRKAIPPGTRVQGFEFREELGRGGFGIAPEDKSSRDDEPPPRQRLGKGFCADYPGHCVAFDTVVRFIGRTRRYLLTATDHASRFAVAIAVPRHDSHHAARFAALVQTLFPGRIRQILTDNASEFQGAFAAYARTQGWRHCHT